MTNLKRAAVSAVTTNAKWSTATLKAPWFDDESIAALQVDAVDNDMKKANSAQLVSVPRADDEPVSTPSEPPSH